MLHARTYRHSHLPWLGDTCNVRIVSLHPPVTSCVSRPNILLNTPFLHPQPIFFFP
jgi:hypothetical protein